MGSPAAHPARSGGGGWCDLAQAAGQLSPRPTVGDSPPAQRHRSKKRGELSDSTEIGYTVTGIQVRSDCAGCDTTAPYTTGTGTNVHAGRPHVAVRTPASAPRGPRPRRQRVFTTAAPVCTRTLGRYRAAPPPPASSAAQKVGRGGTAAVTTAVAASIDATATVAARCRHGRHRLGGCRRRHGPAAPPLTRGGGRRARRGADAATATRGG